MGAIALVFSCEIKGNVLARDAQHALLDMHQQTYLEDTIKERNATRHVTPETVSISVNKGKTRENKIVRRFRVSQPISSVDLQSSSNDSAIAVRASFWSTIDTKIRPRLKEHFSSKRVVVIRVQGTNSQLRPGTYSVCALHRSVRIDLAQLYGVEAYIALTKNTWQKHSCNPEDRPHDAHHGQFNLRRHCANPLALFHKRLHDPRWLCGLNFSLSLRLWFAQFLARAPQQKYYIRDWIIDLHCWRGAGFAVHPSSVWTMATRPRLTGSPATYRGCSS